MTMLRVQRFGTGNPWMIGGNCYKNTIICVSELVEKELYSVVNPMP